jgi:hypothetical protein
MAPKKRLHENQLQLPSIFRLIWGKTEQAYFKLE